MGGSGWYGMRAVAVVRRTRSLVVSAASRVAVMMLAIDAPVRRRTPASSRKTNRMCEPVPGYTCRQEKFAGARSDVLCEKGDQVVFFSFG